MKSVSLQNLEQLFIKLSREDFDNYKTHEDEYKQMWSNQTPQFWVQFVITIRKNIKNQCKNYDESCEKELVTFLKSLTHKNYTEINNYIKNCNNLQSQYEELMRDLKLKFDDLDGLERYEIFGQLRLIVLKLKCAGCFVNTLAKYQEAKEGNEFTFSPPEAWFRPVTTLEPFESFLRSKWGGFSNVEDILGCKKDDIKWWKSPAKKNDQKSDPMEVVSDSEDKIENFLPPEDYQLHGMEVSDINPEENQELSWQTRCWLPKDRTHWNIFGELTFEMKHSDFLWKTNPLFKLWPLMEHSFPPILHEKFFKMDSKLLNEGDPVKYNLAVSTWFVQYVESFGNRYMNFIQQGRDNLASRSTVSDPNLRRKLLEEWKQVRDADNEVLESVMSKPGAPNILQHSAIDPEDFLMEPCVMIQLPWQPVLLRQWLAVALIEILKFELEAVELRHWPIPKDLEPIARELLVMIGDAKERILLGWSVLSFEATTYPKADKKHPAFILDEVVIPSVNVLAFLCSGNAKTIVQSIKKVAWMSNTPLENRLNLPKNAYCINDVLNGFSVLFFGHYTFWKQYNSIRDPFPTVQLTQSLGLEAQLQEIQKGKEKVLPPKEEPFYVNKLSIDEERIFTILQNASTKLPSEYTSEANLAKTRTVLNEVVIKCGHFSKENLDRLLPMLETDGAKQAATDIFANIEESKTPLQQIILSSVLYHDINKYIATIFGQTSVMSWMIRLGAQVTEREQLVRVIAACAVIVQESPRMCGNKSGNCPAECVVTESRFMVKPEMLAHIKEVRDTQESENRDSLFSIFPEDWQEAVDTDPTEHPIGDVLFRFDMVADALQSRIARIIWNASKQNFIEHSKGGESYPDALIVQYLLPCYVSQLIDIDLYPNTAKNKFKKMNLYHFVHNIIRHYEESYRRWVQDSRPRNPMPQHPIPSFSPDEMKRKRILASFNLESASYVLHGYTGLGRLGFQADPLSGFYIMTLNMLDYPMFSSVNQVKSKIEIYNCQTWLKDIYPHTQLLHKVAFQALKLPSPDGLLNFPGLQELYSASLIVHQLEVISSINQSQYPNLLQATEYQEFIEYSEALRIWRYTLFCILFETEKKCKYSQEMIENFIECEGKILIMKVFNIIKVLREKLKLSHKKVQRIEIISYNSSFFKKYNDMYFSNDLRNLKLFKDEAVSQHYEMRRKLGMGITCSSCGEAETTSKEFTACDFCIQKHCQNIKYFCSKTCRKDFWKSQHLEEHLVPELGI